MKVTPKQQARLRLYVETTVAEPYRDQALRALINGLHDRPVSTRHPIARRRASNKVARKSRAINHRKGSK